MADVKVPVEPGQIFAEYLPKLSILSLYVSHPHLNLQNASISVSENKISIPGIEEKNVVIYFDNIEFEPESNKKPMSSSLNTCTFNYRIITKPPKSSSGSSLAEVMPRVANLEDEGLKNMMRCSTNPIVIQEKIPLKVTCRSCSYIFGSKLVFDKVRPLPAGNWAERAHDLWFCHPPHPDSKCHDSSCEADVRHENISDTFKKVRISTKENERSIFDILKSPDRKACYYSSCFWALNSAILQGYSFACFKGTDVQNQVICSNCKNEIGVKFSDECLHLWDFGVEWTKEEVGIIQPESESGGVTDVKIRALDNFKRTVFASIYEWTFSPTCKCIVRPHDMENSLFLWNIDRNLTIYQCDIKSFSNIGNSASSLKSEKVAKFMFTAKVNNQREMPNLNPMSTLEQNMVNDAIHDESQTLIIPDTVFEVGLKHLNETSCIYLPTESLFKCGFLTYKHLTD